MAQPTNREEFKQKCLRSLGAPVIKIEVDDVQVEDKIDDALNLFKDHHFSGSEHVYLKHQVTDTDKTNGYITVPENVFGVVELLDTTGILSFSGWDSAGYQLLLNGAVPWTNISLSSYYMTQMRLEEIDDITRGTPLLRYNRHQNRLYIDDDWEQFNTGDYIIARAYEVVDPETYADVWSDKWLQNYATALIKKQWGSNLQKFEGMLLPGGITFNGAKIFDEALADIERLEDEVKNSSIPPMIMVG